MDAAQLEFWQENGYLIIPNVLDTATLGRLLSTTHHMLASFSLDDHPMTQFTTGHGGNHVGDEYFLTSGDKIRFFFETDAFSSDLELIKPKESAINKIGHYLHHLSPPFQAVTFTALHRALARSLGFRDPRVLQSMVICKQPEIGGQVPPHQDSTFLYTDPPSAVGFWIALEDATKQNGCLSFARGSHRRATIEKRFVRGQSGTEFISVGPRDREYDRDDEVYVTEEVKAGTLVLIHGNVLHKSERNISDRSRFIYTFHVIDQACTYDGRNWLQPPENGFSKLF